MTSTGFSMSLSEDSEPERLEISSSINYNQNHNQLIPIYYNNI